MAERKAERRSLVEGLRPIPEVDRSLEESFVFQKNPDASAPDPAMAAPAAEKPAAAHHGRSPLTTRIRADYAAALKRASLERQLEGVTPNTVQEILEEALEPWLAKHGYLA